MATTLPWRHTSYKADKLLKVNSIFYSYFYHIKLQLVLPFLLVLDGYLSLSSSILNILCYRSCLLILTPTPPTNLSLAVVVADGREYESRHCPVLKLYSGIR